MAEVSATIRILDAFSAPLDKLNASLQRSKSSFSSFKKGFQDGSKGSFEDVNQQATKTEGIFKKMLGANIIGTGITKAIGTITNSLGDAVKRVDTLNNASRSFENMGFTASQTKTAMSDLDTAITGLPTSLDSAVRNTQLLAASTNDIDKSTKIYKAMNDGIVGFGGSAAQVDTAVMQLSQAFSNGKVDMATWNSMINGGMGPALNAIAKTMDMTTGELKSGLSDGTVSVEKFQDALIQLDEKGGGGMKSLGKIAKDSTSGVGTALTNFHTAVTRAVAGGVDALAKAGLTDTINKVTQQLKNAIPTIQSTLTNFVNTAKQSIGNLWSGFKDSGAISSIKEMFSDLGQAVSHIFKSLSNGKDPFAGLKNIGKGVGGGVKALAGTISNIAEAISKLSPGQIQAAAGALKVLVGALIGIKVIKGISGTLNSFSKGISGIAKASKGASGIGKVFSSIGKLSGIGKLLGSLGGVTGALAAAGPVILGIGAAIAVVSGAIYAFKHNIAGFGDFVSGIFEALSGPISSIVDTFKTVFESLKPVFESLKPVFSGIAKVVGTVLVAALTTAVIFISLFADGLKIIVGIAGGVINGIVGIAMAVKALASAKTGNFKQMGKDLNASKEAFGNAGKSFKNGFSNFSTGKVIGEIDKLYKKAGEKPKTVKAKAPTVEKAKVSSDYFNNVEKATKAKKIASPQLQKAKLPGNYLADLTKQTQDKKIKGPTIQKPKVQGGDPTSDIKKKVSNAKIKGPTIQKPKVEGGDPTSDIKKKVSSAKIPAPKIAKPKVPAVDTSAISSAKAKIASQMHSIQSTISSSMRGAASAAKAGMAQVAAAVRSGIQAAVAAGRSGASQMRSIGVMIGQGLAQGMQSQVGAVAAAADALVSQANKAARAKAQVHSPSRLFAEIGGFIGQGLAMGMDGTRNVVAKSGSALINAASGSNGSVKNPYSVQTGKSNNVLNSVTNHSKNNDTGNSSKVVIESGAIQINSTGNADYDGERLVSIMEQYLINKQNAALS